MNRSSIHSAIEKQRDNLATYSPHVIEAANQSYDFDREHIPMANMFFLWSLDHFAMKVRLSMRPLDEFQSWLEESDYSFFMGYKGNDNREEVHDFPVFHPFETDTTATVLQQFEKKIFRPSLIRVMGFESKAAAVLFKLAHC